MSEEVSRPRRSVRKKEKTLEEEIMELDNEMASNRPPLDFQSYQRAVMEKTVPWPISDIKQALVRIMWLSRNAYESDGAITTVQVAAILRHVSEICDSVPISLERVAHISLIELPELQKEFGRPGSEDITKLT